jgi:hypothetical protein
MTCTKKTKSKYQNITILLITFLIVSSCDPADNRLKIINDSNSDIYFTCSCDSSLENVKIFRNGYYSNSIGDSVYVTSDGFVERKSYKNIPRRLGFDAWIYYVKKCPNQEISLYFFLDSIVTKYTDTEIKDLKLFEKHVILSLKDLKQNNWTIIYPR